MIPLNQTAAQQPQGQTAAAPLGASQAGGCPRPAPEALKSAALNQFRIRQNYLQRQRNSGGVTPEEATARLLPWAAMALRCGADPALIHIDLAADLAEPSFLDHRQRVLALADDLCPREDFRPILARARDTAINRLPAEPARAEGPRCEALPPAERGPAAARLGAQPSGAGSEAEPAQPGHPPRPALEGAKQSATIQSTRELMHLARHFGAPAYQPAAEREFA